VLPEIRRKNVASIFRAYPEDADSMFSLYADDTTFLHVLLTTYSKLDQNHPEEYIYDALSFYDCARHFQITDGRECLRS